MVGKVKGSNSYDATFFAGTKPSMKIYKDYKPEGTPEFSEKELEYLDAQAEHGRQEMEEYEKVYEEYLSALKSGKSLTLDEYEDLFAKIPKSLFDRWEKERDEKAEKEYFDSLKEQFDEEREYEMERINAAEEVYSKYLSWIKEGRRLTEAEKYYVKNKIPFDWFEAWEETRIGHKDKIYDYQFKFVQVFNECVNLFFKNKYLKSKYYDKNKIIRLNDVIEFLDLASRDIETLREIDIVNTEGLNGYSEALFNFKVLLQGFFLYSDYDDVSIPTIQFLVDNNFLKKVQHLVHTFKKKYIQSYIFSENRFKDYRKIDEFQSSDFFSDDFVENLGLSINDNIQTYLLKEEKHNNPELLKSIADYLKVSGRQCLGGFFKGIDFQFEDDKIQHKIFEKVLLDLSEEESLDDGKRFRLRRYVEQYKIDSKILVEEMFGRKYKDDASEEMKLFLNKSSKISMEKILAPLIIRQLF